MGTVNRLGFVVLVKERKMSERFVNSNSFARTDRLEPVRQITGWLPLTIGAIDDILVVLV